MAERKNQRRTIRDDRGRLVSPLFLPDLQTSPSDGPQARFAEHIGRFDFATSSWRGVATLLLPAMLAFAVVMPLLNRFLGLPKLVEAAIAGVIIATFLGLSGALFWRWSGGQMARTAVLHGLCGSCGYTLEALVLGDDGCVQCPECGAAWRASNIKRPHWRYPIPRLADQSLWKRFRSRRMGEDDCGVWVQVLDAALLDLPEGVRVGVDRRAAIRRDLRARGRVWRHVLSTLMIAPAAFLLFGALTARDGFFLIVGLMLAMITALGVWMVQRGLGYVSRRGFCKVLKLHGVMPCCGESMAGEPDETGCLTCSRCGARWRRPAPTIRP